MTGSLRVSPLASRLSYYGLLVGTFVCSAAYLQSLDETQFVEYLRLLRVHIVRIESSASMREKEAQRKQSELAAESAAAAAAGTEMTLTVEASPDNTVVSTQSDGDTNDLLRSCQSSVEQLPDGRVEHRVTASYDLKGDHDVKRDYRLCGVCNSLSFYCFGSLSFNPFIFHTLCCGWFSRCRILSTNGLC